MIKDVIIHDDSSQRKRSNSPTISRRGGRKGTLQYWVLSQRPCVAPSGNAHNGAATAPQHFESRRFVVSLQFFTNRGVPPARVPRCKRTLFRLSRLNELIINRSKKQVRLDPVYLRFHGQEGWNVRQVQLGQLLAGKTRNAKRVEALYVFREFLAKSC